MFKKRKVNDRLNNLSVEDNSMDQKASKADENLEILSSKSGNGKAKKSKISKLIGTIVPSSAIILGICVGLYFGKNYFAPKYNPDAYDVNYLQGKTFEEYYSEYKNLMKKNGSLENIDLSSGELKPYELVNLAYGKYVNNEFNYSVSYGTVKASGTVTTIRNLCIKNKNNYMNESLAKGSGMAASIATLSKRFYQNDNGEVKVYIGKVISENKATYDEGRFDENVTTLTDLENKIGRNYSRPTAYIISSKTCLDTSNAQLIINENYYLVSIDLNPENSVARYVKQMNYISNINYPNFKSINVQFKISRNLDLIESEVNEVYVVAAYGINIKTNGYLKEIFHPSEKLEILKLNENYDFEGGLNNEN